MEVWQEMAIAVVIVAVISSCVACVLHDREITRRECFKHNPATACEDP